uniref:Uncharacterized protein n=1 Tax=Lepeophtheirus salmonis TaxID=72036 RepID=A0A0K2UGN9_LEPSM
MEEEKIDTAHIRAIMISAAARYTAFKLKIPNLTNDVSWRYTFGLIKYFPSTSARH